MSISGLNLWALFERWVGLPPGPTRSIPVSPEAPPPPSSTLYKGESLASTSSISNPPPELKTPELFKANPETPTPKLQMPKAHLAIRGFMGVVSIYNVFQDYEEMKRLLKSPHTKSKDYIAPSGGFLSTAVEFASLFFAGTLGLALSIGAGIAGAGFSWWGEINREDDVVEHYLYQALLEKNTDTLNELIDLKHWLFGHIVDDDVLTKLFEKVKKEKPEILNHNNKEWAEWWKDPQQKHFRDSAIGRVEYGFKSGDDGEVAVFLNQSALDLNNLKKEDRGYLYNLERLYSYKNDQPIEYLYNDKNAPITLKELKDLFEKPFNSPTALLQPADMAQPAVADLKEDKLTPDLTAPIEDLRTKKPAPEETITSSKEDPISQATNNLLQVKKLRNKNQTTEAITLAETIRENLKDLDTPEAWYLKGTALELIGVMHYETKWSLKLVKSELTEALNNLLKGKFKNGTPDLELGFVYSALARVASKEHNSKERLIKYTAAVSSYESTLKDERYEESDKIIVKGNLSDIYSTLGEMNLLHHNSDTAKRYFELALALAEENLRDAQKKSDQEEINDANSLIEQAKDGKRKAEQ